MCTVFASSHNASLFPLYEVDKMRDFLSRGRNSVLLLGEILAQFFENVSFTKSPQSRDAKNQTLISSPAKFI